VAASVLRENVHSDSQLGALEARNQFTLADAKRLRNIAHGAFLN